MKVKATAMGYYNHKRRRPGDVFLLKAFKRKISSVDQATKTKNVKEILCTPEMQFSEDWMERVDDKAKIVTVKPQKQFGNSMKSAEAQPEIARAVHEPREDLDEDAELPDDGSEQNDESVSDQDVI